MENGNSNKRKFKERQRKAKQRASQTPEKIQERRAADLRNKARARANETPEQAHERRQSDLRNKARARANETPEQDCERRDANLRSQSRHRERNANSRIEEMVSIPRISEFVEVMDSKAKAFHHILKTRIRHDEQLSHEILDFIQKQDKIKGSGDSSSIPLFLYMNNFIKPMYVSVVIGLFAGLMNYIGLRKLLSFNKSQDLFYQFKELIAVMLYSS